ncbi:hypothetical protein PR048_017218 [Dryococelus australis]|uniref:Major facilitator superfamily (MFS) profile domain-containing protein n=1 Tax=Dryococelus australis TaxID=614101 RepID=A0ABQ9H9J0_9NEOP|nr:hypothetical protein PR048_017218 [Dryococelus australis]
MMITCGYALSIICAFLIPVLAKWSVYALIIARMLQGLAAGAGIPATGQLESSWFPPEERQQLSGITASAYNLGNIMSSCVTGVLIEHFGWEFVFYCYGSLSSLALILWFFLVHDSPTTHPWISEEEKEYICSRIKKVTEVKLAVPWAKIALSPAVWAYLSISAACTWTYFVMATELPTYLRSMLHYGTAEVSFSHSLLLAALCWLACPAYIPGGRDH